MVLFPKEENDVSNKAQITVEVDGNYLNLSVAGKPGVILKASDSELVVRELIRLAGEAPQVVRATVVGDDAPDAEDGGGDVVDFPHEDSSPHQEGGEDLISAVMGVVGDPRVQSSVSRVWGVLQNMSAVTDRKKKRGA